MLRISPVRLVRRGVRNPATLLRTGEHDRTVHPWHAAKLAAMLLEMQGQGGGEVLLRIEWDGAHFLAPRRRRVAEWAADLAFLARHTSW